MGTEGSPVPNSTRDINGDAHLDDIHFFIHLATGELWLHFLDNFLIKKTFLQVNEFHEMKRLNVVR
jgi:hypothetical protein